MTDLANYRLIISENQPVKLVKIPVKSEISSINAASRALPAGVYTTLRTYEGNKLLPVKHHLKRLQTSAALLGYHILLSEWQIYGAVREAVQEYLPGDTRIRLTAALEDKPGELYLSIEPLISPSQEDYQAGVSTVTVSLRRDIPEAKQTSFITTAEQIRKQLPKEAHEGLLIDEQGQILEGMSSNFFYVRDQKVCTAPRDVLSGITRSLVLVAADSQDIPTLFEAAKVSEIPAIEEAFLTSSTRSVLPVRKIDHQIIGDGRVGRITRILSAAYWNVISDRLVEL